jgi:hypothetical protein
MDALSTEEPDLHSLSTMLGIKQLSDEILIRRADGINCSQSKTRFCRTILTLLINLWVAA